MAIQNVYVDNVLRERWDDGTRTYTAWNAAGVQITQRPFNQFENDATDARIKYESDRANSTAIRNALSSGIAQIESAKASAINDVPVADGLRTQANTLRTEALNQRTQVNAFVPGVTYKQSDIIAIRDAISVVIARQESTLQALADFYAYRIAVDNNAIATDDALIGLARILSDRLP